MNIAVRRADSKDGLLKEILEALTQHVSSVELRRFDTDSEAVHGTFYINCKDVDSLIAVQTELARRFPQASVTFVEQSSIPGA